MTGYIMLARQLIESDIWALKPSWWLKIWLYILIKVNHKDNKQFRRGQNYFSYKGIYDDCHLKRYQVKNHRCCTNVIEWLKQTQQIMTDKTTRGFVITVCNYNTFQSLTFYKNDSRNDSRNDTGMTQELHRNDTINKECNNVKNVKNKKHKPIFYDILQYFNKKLNKKLALTPERKAVISNCLNKNRTIEQIFKAIDNFSKDDWSDRNKYNDLIYAIGVKNKIDNFDKWFDCENGKKNETKKTYIPLKPPTEQEKQQSIDRIEVLKAKYGKYWWKYWDNDN